MPKYVFHYTSRQAAQDIIGSGSLKPGPRGKLYLTEVLYTSGAEAANRLGITNKPVEVVGLVPREAVDKASPLGHVFPVWEGATMIREGGGARDVDWPPHFFQGHPVARTQRAVNDSTEARRRFRQLHELPDDIGDVISKALEGYARHHGLKLTAWYHDLPIWMLEAEPHDHRVRRIQVSASRDANGYLALVATADMYELGPDGAVVRVVRSLPEECVYGFPVVPDESWLWLGRAAILKSISEAADRLPEVLDRVWKAADFLTEKDLEPIGSRR